MFCYGLDQELKEVGNPLSAFKSLLKTWGPAWLVMIADVDAASVIAGAENGALYGTKLIWLLIILTIPLFIIQEVAGRTGMVTGKGLGELTRQKFSVSSATLASLPMACSDVLSYAVEYTGIALGLEIFGLPLFISIPLIFILNLVLAYKREYAQVERVLLAVSIMLVIAYGISGYLRISRGGIAFTSFYFSTVPTFLFLVAANIGSTIQPFMLFYQSSAAAEKRTGAENLWAMRLETLIGAIVSELIVIAIEIASIGINSGSASLVSPQVLSNALSNVVGPFAPYLFGVGLVSAGFVALIVVSLGSAWGVTESLGLGRNSLFKVYLTESISGLVISVLPFTLVKLALSLLALDVVVLIGPGIVLGLVASDKELMGNHSLRGLNRLIYWTVLFVMVGAGIASLV